MSIRILPPDVVSKIAAGEVVERPASVVKELIENAIDAGAKEIKVEIREGGQRLVRVGDDGVGIPAAEVELAFARHSTSKISSPEDLERIVTLGFRGEALASIAAVSHLTMLTRAEGEEMGTWMRLEGGHIIRRESRGALPGTVVSVENLFFNVPARRKFLRQTATEAGHASEVVTFYALAFPALRFQFVKDGRLVFRSTGSGELFDVLIKVYGLQTARQMVPLREEERLSDMQVEGYVSPPGLSRASRDHLIFFVNRRHVRDRLLSRAVIEAYHTLLPGDRYPIAILYVSLPSEQVDVNVHPAKSEIRFLNPDEVFHTVQRAVRHTLKASSPLQALSAPPHRGEFPLPSPRLRREEGELTLALEVQRPAEQEISLQAPTLGTRLPMLRVLGQVGQTYIIAEGPDGLYLIDQHTAHERVLYERLRAEKDRLIDSAQHLLTPLTLELTPRQQETLAACLEEIAALGFEIEPFGGETHLVRAVPAILAGKDISAALIDLLDALAEGGEPEEEALLDQALTTLACHGAVRAGKTLSLEEMRDLIRQLEKTQLPHTCPHGRPIMKHLSTELLAREFGRR